MKPTKSYIKTVTVIAGAALIPTAAVFVTGVVSNAIAATSTQNFSVSASVNSNCTFPAGTTNMGFGAYDPLVTNATSNLDATSTFKIRCTKNGSATLSLGLGDNAGVGTQRKLIGATYSDLVNYDLYSDAGRSSAWNTTNTVTYNQGNANSNPTTMTIYGRIPSGQDVSADTYSDTVTITATFN